MHKIILTISCVCFIHLSSSLAQEPWMKPFENTTHLNFYDIQKNFYSTYHKQYSKYLKELRRKGKGEEEGGDQSLMVQYKRWENFWQPRINSDGSFPPSNTIYTEWKRYQAQQNASDRSSEATANWTSLGPGIVPSGTGSGRINVVRFDPNNSNKIYVGAASGGLWVSTNSGSTWSTTTDLLPSIGVTDVAIDPNNSDTIYIATGDGDAGDTYSVGIMKSVDGGSTWDTTGLTWAASSQSTISRLLINPDSSNVLLTGTSEGIYKSENSGATWTRTSSTSVKDMAFMPFHSNTVYAAGTSFFKSVNGGETWQIGGTGLPTNVARIAIAVSKSDSNLVLVLVSAPDYGLQGLYKSTDAGETFTLLYNSLNLLGWASDGSDVGGQGWYDLTLAVSQYTADTIYTGGVDVWQSTNGGQTFSIYGYWAGPFGGPYVHADDHFLTLSPNERSIYVGCDGGLYQRSFSSHQWNDLSSNLSIMQIYSLSSSATIPDLITTGAQDNGTCETTGINDWSEIIGGDGMQTIIDYANPNIIYGETEYGNISISSDGGNNFTNIDPNTNAPGAWVTPYVIDPNNDNVLYAGLQDVYKTTDYGSSWTNMTNGQTEGYTYVALAVAPSNSNVVYALINKSIFRSLNAGTTWMNVRNNLPGEVNLTAIAVKGSDPYTLWITSSGFNEGNEVYKSVDSGAIWTNVSSGLPAIPANCIVYQNNSNDDLYVGTDLGVYYINNTMSDWVPYNDGLPNVIIDQLSIQYSSSELRAATYGRGVWETNLVTPAGIQQVSDNSDAAGITIYPNPATDNVNIEFAKNYSGPILISLYNVLGQLEMQSNLASVTTDQSIQLDISGLSKGIHLVKVISSNQVIAVQKLVVIN